MKCENCEGKGKVQNPKREEARWKYKTDFYLAFEPYIKCKTCQGAGYMIENISEVLDLLESISRRANLEKEDLLAIEKCINFIKN